MSTSKPVIIYGASGYTGRLIAEYLREYLKAVPEGKDSEMVRKQLGSIEEFARAKAEPKTEP